MSSSTFAQTCGPINGGRSIIQLKCLINSQHSRGFRNEVMYGPLIEFHSSLIRETDGDVSPQMNIPSFKIHTPTVGVRSHSILKTEADSPLFNICDLYV